MMLKDVQNEKDTRELPIDQVGVRDLKYPIIVEDKLNKFQSTVAKIEMAVNLPHHFRGTHMSRFLEVLNRYRGHLSEQNIFSLLEEMENTLESEKSYFKAEFPYFIEREAPVSKAKSLMSYTGIFIGEKEKNKNAEFILGAEVPITSLCPCSKEISEEGAHNQRSIITVKVKYEKMVWLEDLISLIETSGSCEIYPLLKRQDEKYVTEKAYRNPQFVEDIVRDVANKLKQDGNIKTFDVHSLHFESIHDHNVFARISAGLED